VSVAVEESWLGLPHLIGIDGHQARFSALPSDPMALSGAAREKQIPSIEAVKSNQNKMRHDCE